MKLIVGLGNPGKKYSNTRHNLGFMVIDALAKKHGLDFKKCRRTGSLRTPAKINGQNHMLAKPMTFMNRSGESVLKLMNFYKVKPHDLWVVQDDIDLALGKIRVKNKISSSGGHQGIASIIAKLGQTPFNRLKIGIGSNREARTPAERYVLQKFSDHENKAIALAIDQAVAILEKNL